MAELQTRQPTRAMVDEKVNIDVKNVGPGQMITLHSLHCSENQDMWEAFGHYLSDQTGTVSAAEDVSLGGTYEGLEPMGLLWSMRPVPGSAEGIRLRKKNVQTPQLVQISAYLGHLSQGFSQRPALASAVLERWWMAPGVQRQDITDSIRGTLFLPPGPGPHPAVLQLLGGGGGLFEYQAALLASHGYVTLVMHFITSPTATSHKQISDFETAYGMLRDHPQVAGDRMALFGFSIGGSVSLALAAASTVIKPRCVVCISGNHLFTFKTGFSEIHDQWFKNLHKATYDENNHLVWKNLTLPIANNEAKTEVGRLPCLVLMVTGEDDHNCAASEAVQDMRKMMEKAGNSHHLTNVSYPGAGHLIEPPYTPHVRSSNFLVLEKKQIMLWGGQPKPHAFAQEDSWRRILGFLREHLYQRPKLHSVSAKL